MLPPPGTEVCRCRPDARRSERACRSETLLESFVWLYHKVYSPHTTYTKPRTRAALQYARRFASTHTTLYIQQYMDRSFRPRMWHEPQSPVPCSSAAVAITIGSTGVSVRDLLHRCRTATAQSQQSAQARPAGTGTGSATWLASDAASELAGSSSPTPSFCVKIDPRWQNCRHIRRVVGIFPSSTCFHRWCTRARGQPSRLERGVRLVTTLPCNPSPWASTVRQAPPPTVRRHVRSPGHS